MTKHDLRRKHDRSPYGVPSQSIANRRLAALSKGNYLVVVTEPGKVGARAHVYLLAEAILIPQRICSSKRPIDDRCFIHHKLCVVRKRIVDSQLELRIRSSCEWTYVVICGIGCPLGLWGIWGFADFDAQQFSGQRHEWLEILLFRAAGAPGFQFVAAVMGMIAGAVGIGAIWRLLDQRPSISAGPDGVLCHPSICPAALTWNEVENIEITKNFPRNLSIKLHERRISLYMPITERHVNIPLGVSGWTYREAEENVAQMRRWKRDAAIKS
jgi:hypothetical protein